jgi:hypothetical protein
MFDPPEYIDKINKNKHNYWFLVSFSLLSIVLHLLPLSTRLHNILYSANVFSLIGFTIIITFYPYRLYNYFGETFRNIIYMIGLSRVIEFNIYWLYLGAWIVHFIPVYIFRNKYSFGNPISWILLYFVFAGPFLGKIYNLTFYELSGVFLSTSILLMTFLHIYRESFFI